MSNETMQVSREFLTEILKRMEDDWWQIDSEWGPVRGGLDGDISRGNAKEIGKLRTFLANPYNQTVVTSEAVGVVTSYLKGNIRGFDGVIYATAIINGIKPGDLLYLHPAEAPLSKFNIDDKVVKVTGDYRISGIVRAVFTMTNGAVRLVVEHKAEGGGSFLHIYGENNLEHQP